ncbi:MAG: cupin domain-containing protein [Lachnospira sp.]
MNEDCFRTQTDCVIKPYTVNVSQKAMRNTFFRTTLWTGNNVQMTLMSIPQCSDIGIENHPDTDQIIRIEQGMAVVMMGKCKNSMDYQKKCCIGDTIFVPAGTWHNVINIGRTPLKVSSIYAPPHHLAGTVHRTKKDAEESERMSQAKNY